MTDSILLRPYSREHVYHNSTFIREHQSQVNTLIFFHILSDYIKIRHNHSLILRIKCLYLLKSTLALTYRVFKLEQLIDYVAEPYFFLTCKSCRVVLPLSRVPAYFSSLKYHSYSYKDCVDVLEAWQALHLWSRPVKLRNEDDLRDWSFPVTLPAPIPQLRTLYAFHCRHQ
jgi:hypothetical protein